MSFHDLDKGNFKRMADKHIENSDGKAPVERLSEDYCDKWKGVNLEGHETNNIRHRQSSGSPLQSDPSMGKGNRG